MKKTLLALLLCMALALSACTSASSSTAAVGQQNRRTTTSSAVSQTGTDEFAHIGRIEEDVEIPVEFPWELVPNTDDVPAPDFLTAQQQDLYRQARTFLSIYEIDPSSLGSAYMVPLVEGQQELEGGERVEVDGMGYYLSTSRYRNWDDFEATCRHMFTENMFSGDSSQGFAISINGRLALHEGARGSSISYGGTPDRYELIVDEEDRIEFLLIAHHMDISTDDWMDREKNGEYDYTEQYTITLVNTDGQWRFDEFHIPF